MRSVPVLCTCPGSIYLTLPGTDCWDEQRDAMKFDASDSNQAQPIITHPPCAQFGSYAHKARDVPKHRELTRQMVKQVHWNLGVLEHPAFSKLWNEFHLPLPGQPAQPHPTCASVYRKTVELDQVWFGHRARKRTWLLVVARRGFDFTLPAIPSEWMHRQPTHIIGYSASSTLPELPREGRHRTPLAFAEWLLTLARNIGDHNERNR